MRWGGEGAGPLVVCEVVAAAGVPRLLPGEVVIVLRHVRLLHYGEAVRVPAVRRCREVRGEVQGGVG